MQHAQNDQPVSLFLCKSPINCTAVVCGNWI